MGNTDIFNISIYEITRADRTKYRMPSAATSFETFRKYLKDAAG
jgi:hypothetical protein